MAKETKIALALALSIAEGVIKLLRPACDRIEIAGSIRRQKPLVSDIELILLPKLEPVNNMFGETSGHTNLEFELAKKLRAERVFTDRPNSLGAPAFGEKFQRFLYKGIPLDLFCVTPPAEWGMQMVIRTGPQDFSHRFVTPWSQGGKVLRVGFAVVDGALRDKDVIVPTPEEIDVFRAVGLDYIDPAHRDLAGVLE